MPTGVFPFFSPFLFKCVFAVACVFYVRACACAHVWIKQRQDGETERTAP